MKSSCPKRRANRSTPLDFCRGSVYQQRISWGGDGGECEKAVVLKGASAIGPQLWGEVFTPE